MNLIRRGEINVHEKTVKKESSLTEGTPGKVLLKFALPVIFSMIATQFYALADSMIVGKMLGEQALAAVSNAANVMSFFLIISGGMELGGSLLISGHYMNSSDEELQRDIWNLIITDLIIAIIVTVSGIYLTAPLLRITNTPQEIFDKAVLYGNVYLVGLPFLMEYDLMKEILIGTGDSKTPMNLILLTSLVNIIADLIMVPIFGVAGAAWATALSQLIGCILTFMVLRKNILHTNLRKEMMSTVCLKEIGRLAPPYMIQQSSIILLSLFRQTLLGNVGIAAIAGFSASSRITSLLFIPVAGLCQAFTVFIAQNSSVNKTDRITEGLKSAYLICAIYVIPVALICILLRNRTMLLFADDAETIMYGSIMLAAWPAAMILYISEGIEEAVLRGYQKMVYYLISSISTEVICIISTVIMVKMAGFSGFWISNIIGYGAGAVISLGLVRKIIFGQKE